MPAAPATGVRVSEADPDGFLQDVITAHGHHLRADEPADHGGTDIGPSPYDLLSAALGTCTSMTIRMYARRKGIALSHVSVDVIHDRVHAEDCHGCETATGQVDRFRRRIRLEGALDAQTRKRLLEIADRCPVHRTLENEIRIETEAT